MAYVSSNFNPLGWNLLFCHQLGLFVTYVLLSKFSLRNLSKPCIVTARSKQLSVERHAEPFVHDCNILTLNHLTLFNYHVIVDCEIMFNFAVPNCVLRAADRQLQI